MKRIAKRQFFLLGCASLAAMLLSLYDRYGIVLTSSRSFLAEQSQLQEQVLRENQEKGGNRSTGQRGKESKTMAENKAGAETETAEKDERMASDANPDIRVLLCSDNYASEYHDRITISGRCAVSGERTKAQNGTTRLVSRLSSRCKAMNFCRAIWSLQWKKTVYFSFRI